MNEVLSVIRGIDPLLLNSLTFLVGLICGHRIALMRDKRQEFNAAVLPVRAKIIGAGRMPSPVEIDSFEHLMWPLSKGRLRKAIADYYRCAQEQERVSETGARSYADESAIRKAELAVLASLKPR